jgi:hypothetical protein
MRFVVDTVALEHIFLRVVRSSGAGIILLITRIYLSSVSGIWAILRLLYQEAHSTPTAIDLG